MTFKKYIYINATAVGDAKNVKVSVDDGSPNFLEQKIAPGSTKLVETILNPGGNEIYQLDVDETQINHDNLLNFVAAEHVDHTSVLLNTNADSGLTGGGDISASRTLSVDISGTTSETVVATTDQLLVYDVSAMALRRFTVDDLCAAYVKGPATSTNNAIARYDGTTGKIIQNSSVIIDDSDNITGVNNLTVGGNLTVDGTTTTVNSATLDVADANITVNVGGNQAAADLNKAGLTVEMSDATDYVVGYDSGLTSGLKIGPTGSEVEVVTTTQAQTLSSKTLTSPIINGNLTGDAVLDEDNFVSNSATKIATQQSIKAYVDNAVAQYDEFTELTDTPASYASGDAAKVVRVNALETGLEFHTLVQASITDVTASATEVNYLVGVTSAVQTQLNAKIDDFTSSNDNRLVRTDGATGEAIQDSGITIDDTDNISGIVNFNSTGNLTQVGTTNITRALRTTGATHSSQDLIQTEAAAGDASTLYSIRATQEFIQGIDNSDGDKFKISRGSVLGTNDVFVVDSTSNIEIGDSAAIIASNSHLEMVDNTELRLREAVANGTHYVAIKAPADVAANFSLTLPDNNGTSGQAITTDGSGNLSFTTIISDGDIRETSFSAANNQTTSANVTGLAFNNAIVRSFDAHISVEIDATSNLYEIYNIRGVQKDAGWNITITSSGDDSGIDFTITSTGQVQYTSSNVGGFVSSSIKFRAITTSI